LEPEVTPAPYFERKYLLDYVLSLALSIICLPIMVLFIGLVKLTSRGPAIYSQCRTGKNGRKFMMYKIRSMRHDAEAYTGPAWTQSADPRVTLLGRFMRKFHIDELPQLFNVLRGDMSLVGPRPERPEFVEVLCRQIPEYKNRIAVKPGITGLAQLNLPPDSDLDSVRRKILLDIEYIEKASLSFDLKVILCTALRFTKLPILGIFGIRRNVILPEVDSQVGYTGHVGSVVSLKQFQMQIESSAKNGNLDKPHVKKHLDRSKCQKKVLQ
jgi:lipopolysaccharide/colanic/teichoic acid biosynthesis glycosyltransferase